MIKNIQIDDSKKELITKVFYIIIALLVIIGTYFFYTNSKSQSGRDQFSQAYKDSLINNNPEDLQEVFVNDVKSGKNDPITKASAYFITHRYFDNGGDIYEIYNYIEKNPELVFLKEAEAIYPKSFNKLKEGSLPKTGSYDSLYVYLAYLEIMEKNGYLDMAGLSTLMNKYAEIAYSFRKINDTKGIATSSIIQKERITNAVEKSKFYKEKVSPQIYDIVKNNNIPNDIVPSDISVGLSQYATAIRYYRYMKLTFTSEVTSKEVFDFASDYSAKNVQELYLFSHFLNASTLAMMATSSAENANIDQILKPMYSTRITKELLSRSSLFRNILGGKLNTGKTDFGFYSKANIVALAKISPNFKAWLVTNGWTDADFK